MGQKHAAYDPVTGFLAGFFDEAVNSPEQIESFSTIPISDDQWADWYANQGKYLVTNGALTQNTDWPPKPPALTYADKRHAAYPAVVDQLDTLYHGGFDGWHASIKAIKDQFPKP